MSRKIGLTPEQHREAAILMKQAYENAVHLQIIFAKAYGKTKEPCLSLKKAAADLMKAKDKADDIFCGEIPKVNSPYFGAINKPTTNVTT